MSYRFATIAGRRYLVVRYSMGLATYTERDVLFERQDDELVPVLVLDLVQDDNQSRADEGRAPRRRASWAVHRDVVVYRWRDANVDRTGVELELRRGVQHYRRSANGQFSQARANRE